MNVSPLLHPTDQTLHAYGLGKLDDASTSTIDSHLEECPECRRRVADLSGDSFLGRLRAGATSAGVEPGSPAGPKPPRPVGQGRSDALPEELSGQYELVRELGRGGMGVVWLARNRMLDRLEALKILNKDMLERRGTLDRFLREIRMVAQLNHENVVRAYSALQLGESIIFVLEYVEGLDLAKLVKQRGPLPVPHACFFAHQAALGLQHAHERGMVHRDIKPGNLILRKDGQRAIVKVLDFGLAKALSEQSVDGGLTHEGQMLGTPDYIAPEQTLNAQNADIRADIYSLGCTLYYLLAGAPPFQGTSLYDILQAHQSMDARPLNLLRPEVPIELAALIGKMMAKDPERRFHTPSEVAKALSPFFKKVAPPSSAPEPVALVQDPPAALVAAHPATTVADPGTEWRSLIDFQKTERASEPETSAVPRPQGRGPRRRWPLVAAAAAGFAAVLLGVVISFSIRRDRDKLNATLKIEQVPGPKAAKAQAAASSVKLNGPAQVGGGAWSVERDELVQTNERSNGPDGSDWYYITFGDPEWSNYDFYFEANRYKGVDSFGALFHWLGPDHNRLFANGGYGGKWSELRDHFPSKNKTNAGPSDWWQRKPDLCKEKISEPNYWYRVRIEVRDATVRCYLDDELFFEDTDSRYTHGCVGLSTWATPVRFRKIRVTDPAGNLLWDGVPELTDALQPGSVWVTHTDPVKTLTVHVRDGEHYTAHYTEGANDRMVRGTIRNGTLRALAKDTKVIKGSPDVFDTEATLHGEEMFVSWSGSRPGPSGTYTLHLKKEPPSAPSLDPRAPAKESAPTAAPGPGPGEKGTRVPDDAKRFQNKRYKAFAQELTWHDARSRSEALGGRLVVIKSADENRCVIQAAEAAGLEHAWIGASDVVEEGKWLWIDGTPVLYNAWDAGQPNNHSPQGETEHYAALIVRKGVWWDQPDRAQRGWHPGFVCQWDDESAAKAQGSSAGEFVPLFNGKDLTGWKVHPAGTGRWTVENGLLVGRGPYQSHLFTERSDYTDFHARIEAKINAGGNSGFCFRTEFFGTGQLNGHGYEANIDNTLAVWRTGSLMHLGDSGHFSARLVNPDEWFTMDVIAVGKRIIVKVNGQTTVDFVDPGATYPRGRLALQQLGSTTVASFRKVEVKELRGTNPELRGDYVTLFTGKDPVGWEGLLPYWKWRDGALIGAPLPNASAHTFLCSKRQFRDFELRFRVRRLNGFGNSGVQFRSALIDRQGYKVRGPQCEIESAGFDLAPPGSMVMEADRSPWILAPRDAVAKVYFDTEFNDFLIRCVGKHVTIRVNGVTTVDAEYAALPDEGIIAWQLHGKKTPTIEFRDVVLLDLSAPAAQPTR